MVFHLSISSSEIKNTKSIDASRKSQICKVTFDCLACCPRVLMTKMTCPAAVAVVKQMSVVITFSGALLSPDGLMKKIMW